MSPLDFLVIGCFLGAFGGVSAIAMIVIEEWQIKRGADDWRRDMNKED